MVIRTDAIILVIVCLPYYAIAGPDFAPWYREGCNFDDSVQDTTNQLAQLFSSMDILLILI